MSFLKHAWKPRIRAVQEHLLFLGSYGDIRCNKRWFKRLLESPLEDKQRWQQKKRSTKKEPKKSLSNTRVIERTFGGDIKMLGRSSEAWEIFREFHNASEVFGKFSENLKSLTIVPRGIRGIWQAFLRPVEEKLEVLRWRLENFGGASGNFGRIRQQFWGGGIPLRRGAVSHLEIEFLFYTC